MRSCMNSGVRESRFLLGFRAMLACRPIISCFFPFFSLRTYEQLAIAGYINLSVLLHLNYFEFNLLNSPQLQF